MSRLQMSASAYKRMLKCYIATVQDPNVGNRDLIRVTQERYNHESPYPEKITDTGKFNSMLTTLHSINHRVRKGRKPHNGLYTFDQEMRGLFPYKNRLERGYHRRGTGRLREKLEPPPQKVTPLPQYGKRKPSEDVTCILITIKADTAKIEIDLPLAALPKVLGRMAQA